MTPLATAGVALGAGMAGYAVGVEPAWFEVHAERARLARLAPAFHGYRIAQISDLHMGDWMNRARLDAVVDLVNQQQPDLIAITGDFTTRHPERVAGDLAAGLRRLAARDGVVAVLGNHDHWTSAAATRDILRAGGVRDLSNAVWPLERDGGRLFLAGVDSALERKQRLDLVLDRLPRSLADGAALLLAHEPDIADVSAATGRFGVQLSGHTHGGQIVAPFFGPPMLPPLGRNYPIGRYRVGAMIQYTNRGVGMTAPFVRFNCRPEITVMTLESPDAR